MFRAVKDFHTHPQLLLLKPGIQHYAWGDTRFIPDLLGLKNPENLPHAELWMGAHPNLPSKAILGDAEVDLGELLDNAGEALLGPEVFSRFRRMPYLLKVLCAARPLSIQVHPTKEQAEEGFARENASGIPVSAPHRNYKDDNHKPELIVAITDFYALRGFRPLEEIAEVLQKTPELRVLLPGFEPTSAGLRAFTDKLLNLKQEQVDATLTPLVQRLGAESRKTPFSEEDPRYWILRGDGIFSSGNHRDRGLLFVYLLNLIHLKPGQAMHMPAAILHSYLQGMGVELMASSDNVLRCGLTPKHVDVLELLKVVSFTGEQSRITEATKTSGSNEWVYRTPAEEFELRRRIEITPSEPHKNGPDHSVEILAVLALERGAEVTVSACDRNLKLGRGSVLLVPHGKGYDMEATGWATLYKATVPWREVEH